MVGGVEAVAGGLRQLIIYFINLINLDAHVNCRRQWREAGPVLSCHTYNSNKKNLMLKIA